MYDRTSLARLASDIRVVSEVWVTHDEYDEVEQFVFELPLAYFRFEAHDRYGDSTRYEMDTLFRVFVLKELTDGGIVVSPKLDPDSHAQESDQDTLSSGIPEADEHLHGGLERDTVTVISGPTGAGKTTTGSQFVKEAASRGEHSVIYLFEESRETSPARSESVNIPGRNLVDSGPLRLKEIESSELSVDEFAQDVRHEVEEQGARIVMIDGVAGYRLAIRSGNSWGSTMTDACVLALLTDARDRELIVDSLDRSDGLGDDVFAPARYGSELLDREQLAVGTVAEATWTKVETTHATLSTADDLGAVSGDEGQMTELFEYLVRNAVEHGSTTGRHEGRVTSLDAGDQPPTELAVTVTPTESAFAVADNGPGIPDDEREDVFTDGYSGTEGSGLGRSIVETIAEARGWEVDVAESECDGVRFEIHGG